ncbi:MAG: hypothetical protein GW772_08775 [Flavobacteriia bacterium]|nr:hypothetical protein [Flavobacteriia bacterium]OIP47694.1 MAG: hypothetical protein AUK46_04105 [Flavobacteriaceae bacterium CG2_30_31_66]PIV97384.1 MAG: hypothetical protein COW43_03075 [Flavobacteriaceae bacterium CG17_big_fil_post_rev_8_21_14_2_50_31_13]PIX14220.1 MAG: hypothetical protein COZ74_03525 [Flavobacteriaceae bacterium CG_4_8_14_3_um_filter_31_8]PIY14742.1 MAG: hypothetical protein COZ16_07315 [Flavobacteriaceae bacterium CG_4_10_14_3_um_filter_31_253]PIZ12091.1 MAG: hypotheti
MEITKEQIQSIENRLEKNGLNYWDIRIEILDHLVSDIENRMEKGESYKSALESSFFNMNLTGNLEALNRSKLFAINKIVRKQYFKRTLQMVTNPIDLFVICLSFFCYFLLCKFSSLLVFQTTTMIILLTPLIIGLVLYFKEFLQKKKSGYLIYSSFYIFFSFLMLNLFLQFIKPDGIIPVSKETQLFIWFLITCVNSIFATAGILIHLKTLKKLKMIERKLLLE